MQTIAEATRFRYRVLAKVQTFIPYGILVCCVAVAEPAAAASWAMESCKLVEAKGFYPEIHKVGEAYLEEQQGTLKRQLASASKRLAATLNDSLK